LPNSKIIRTAPEAQGEKHWEPPSGTLGELTERAWARSQALGPGRDRGEIAAARTRLPRLREVLRKDHLAIIAEIKRMSPSKGEINPGIDSGEQAASYAAGGASAISVLTEPLRFGGSDRDIDEVCRAVTLPVLKKDFHVSEAQLIHAAETGASAALIIVRAIEPSRLLVLMETARELALELVLEVRNESELDRAINAGGEIIGVNNRDLETLEIDRATVKRIVPLIPAGCIVVAESGYSTVESVEEAAASGADAVLVGSSLSAATDPASAVRAIAGVPRQSRGAPAR
jgi:indole-3-glycerol phosphate synthase